MKVLSICHSSGTCSSLSYFIIFFITFYVHKLESASFTVIGPDHPITAVVGEDILLPCHLSPRMNAENMEVRWFRSDFTSFVHLYQDGRDQYGQQMPDYHERTELLKDGIMDGNVVLRIVNIRLSDEGKYRCLVRDGDFYEEAVLELKVTASGSAPHISVEGHQDGGIRVVCHSAGWYPKPEVLWRDVSGKPLSLSTETKSAEEHGFFEIKNSIIIKENSNQNLSCSVRNTRLNQEKESITFYISDSFFPRVSSWAVAWSVTLVILLVFIGSSFFLFRLKGKHQGTIGELQTALEVRRSLSDAVIVTLDPSMAHSNLVLLEDQRSVSWKSTQKDLPENPEKLDTECCVLGCDGFTSGKHRWEVEVVGGQCWAMGVARESVGTERWISRRPAGEIWAIGWWAGQLQALNCSESPQPMGQFPNRIQVCLDCDQRQVTFFNAGDGVPIFTFPANSIPKKEIHPWFCVGPGSQLRLYLRHVGGNKAAGDPETNPGKEQTT